jgi:mono/diheme cytochrome c family protein
MHLPLRFGATALLALGALPFCGQSRAADEATLRLGRQVFLERSEPRCSLCHALADAGATGAVGPSLDALKPDTARVKAAVENGIGVMPPNEALSPDEIAAVALYVSTVAARK